MPRSSMNRGYLRGRISELARPATRAASEPLGDWAVRRIRLENRPFSFEGHGYLRAIYDDGSPHICLVKAAQIGGSTWAILRTFHAAAHGLHVMYLFPTRSDVLDFSRGRINPLLDQNRFLAEELRETDTIGLKRIGSAYVYFRGMQSSVGLKSVPADMIVFDELDEATPQAKAMALERLSHSDYKRVIELSNPSLPDYGVDEVFQRSDQRHWTLKCPACGAWTAMDKEFPKRLGEEVRVILQRQDSSYYRACIKCGTELDPEAGEWVADFPGRPIHGYLISQLFSSTVEPGEIVREYRTTRYPDRFFNLKIGIAWADLQRRLDVSTVLALCGDQPLLGSSDRPCSMGVDTGRGLHVVILRDKDAQSQVQELVYLEECHEFSELDALIQRFQVDRCVIDAFPESHATTEFAKRHHGKVFMSLFVESQRGGPSWDDHTKFVKVNRTDALDASRAAIREKLVVLPRRQPILEEFAEHMSADAKTLDEDEETGAQRYRYIKTGVNHFSFAFTYAWMATDPNVAWRGFMRYIREQRDAAKA